jgi:hypothetical protein
MAKIWQKNCLVCYWVHRTQSSVSLSTRNNLDKQIVPITKNFDHLNDRPTPNRSPRIDWNQASPSVPTKVLEVFDAIFPDAEYFPNIEPASLS